MSQHLSVWIVVLAALCAANLPFATRRVLGAVPLRKGKTLPIRLLELVVLYFVVGGIGLLLLLLLTFHCATGKILSL